MGHSQLKYSRRLIRNRKYIQQFAISVYLGRYCYWLTWINFNLSMDE